MAKRVHILMSDTIHAAIEQEATLAGESVSEFIRSAAFARAIYRFHMRDPHNREQFGVLYDQAIEYDRRHPVNEEEG